jgi:hypothetical protein
MDGWCKSANQACLLSLRSYNACWAPLRTPFPFFPSVSPPASEFCLLSTSALSEPRGTVIYSTKLSIIHPSTPSPFGSTLSPLQPVHQAWLPPAPRLPPKPNPDIRLRFPARRPSTPRILNVHPKKSSIKQGFARTLIQTTLSRTRPCLVPFYLPDLGPLLTKPSDIHGSLDLITSHIKSYRSGSRPVYDPLQKFLEETPHEQPWSTPVHFAKGTEKDGSGK